MIYTLRHLTTYRYRRPARFARCAIRLAPSEGEGQTVLSRALAISPEPATRASRRDFFGAEVTSVTVATPHRFHGDAGEIALLDADLNFVAGPEPLGTLSPLTGAVPPVPAPRPPLTGRLKEMPQSAWPLSSPWTEAPPMPPSPMP